MAILSSFQPRNLVFRMRLSGLPDSPQGFHAGFRRRDLEARLLPDVDSKRSCVRVIPKIPTLEVLVAAPRFEERQV
jgi:hypothetical protein